MKRNVATLTLVLALAATNGLAQEPVGTVFTYQGQLKQNGSPVTGSAEFIFTLWDAPTGGNQIGQTVQTGDAHPVVDGLFTVELDFNPPTEWIFDGTAFWLEVQVDYPAGSGSWETLSPRQRITATPFASFSTLSTAVPWVGILDMPAGFADGVDDIGDGSFWSLTGNAGTTPGTNFLGTTDDTPLELHVNGMRALRLEPRASGPNIVAGHPNNAVDPAVTGATIAGGVNNLVQADYGAIGGGSNNQANGTHSVAAGGSYNSATGERAVVVGGYSNGASGAHSAVVGGQNNAATGDPSCIVGGSYNEASATHSFVGAGYNNSAIRNHSAVMSGNGNWAGGSLGGDYAVVCGGYGNAVRGDFGFIGSGDSNTVHNQVELAAIVGGRYNEIKGRMGAIGGGERNVIETEAEYATISGGGPTDPNDPTNTNNKVYDHYGTIGGGGSNRAGSDDADPSTSAYAAIGGGQSNRAAGLWSTVGGGLLNDAAAAFATIAGGGPSDIAYPSETNNHVWDDYGTIAGGGGNSAGSNDADPTTSVFATVAGGQYNVAGGSWAAVGGGFLNDAAPDFATISGGGPSDLNDPTNTNNKVYDQYGTIGGGGDNHAGSDDSDPTTAGFATVFGGQSNVASGPWSTVGGGHANNAAGITAAVGGGAHNNASGNDSTVAGGFNNTASGYAATVPGGSGNIAAGDVSIAAGYRAHANHNGTFVWGDYTYADFASTGDNQFLVRAAGGVGIGTNAPTSMLHVVDDENVRDSPAILGEHVPEDSWGIGVRGVGGYKGVVGEVWPTGDYYYYGAQGIVSGGSGTNYGVFGYALGTGTNYGVYGYAVDGLATYSGYFAGDAHVTGDFTCSGTKSFKIDHPLDPENKYLYHSCVESPDMMNVYNGNVVTDERGHATVELPEWFETLNRDFRYQLTVIGQFAQAIVAEEIHDNMFVILTDTPDVKVSWQVTGVRQDPWAEANRMLVEVDKPDHERGKFLYPEGYGVPNEFSVDYEARHAARPEATDKGARK
jgi:hypothetical protein